MSFPFFLERAERARERSERSARSDRDAGETMIALTHSPTQPFKQSFTHALRDRPRDRLTYRNKRTQANRQTDRAGGRQADREPTGRSKQINALPVPYSDRFMLELFGSVFGLCWFMLALLAAMLGHLVALGSHVVAKLFQNRAKMVQHSSM